MNLIRSIITALLVLLLVMVIAGWNWAGGLPYDKMIGARCVLSICALACLGTTVLLWREKHPLAAGE